MSYRTGTRRPNPPKARVYSLALALLITMLATACSEARPPNNLTTMLRALPVPETGFLSRVTFSDLREARRQGGEAHDLPEVVTALHASTIPLPPAVRDEISTAEVESWIEISPTGSPAYTMLVGNFDTERMAARLAELPPPETVELFQVYDVTSGTVAVNPRRIVYSSSPTAARQVASFRGGEESLLSVPGLQHFAVRSGRPALVSVFAPSSGCPRARWAGVAARFDGIPGGLRVQAAFVLQYDSVEQAHVAFAAIRTQLSRRLPDGATVGVVDSRLDQAVATIGTDPPGISALVSGSEPGGRLDGLPECA